ncbi:hypothetical protein [Haloparvum sp. PAK95]|uniref:hypothetical protein n=1 Tax=Haloparvum sp. PAK95 TaxID=3418962 RepID=UPI003D2ED566
MRESAIEGVSEEVLGTITGLPPGTVTAATTFLGKLTDSPSESEKSAVESKSSGLSKKEKKVLDYSVMHLADTHYYDHPRASKRYSVRYAVDTIRAALKMYSPSHLRLVFKNALSRQRRDHRAVMKSVKNDIRKRKALKRL